MRTQHLELTQQNGPHTCWVTHRHQLSLFLLISASLCSFGRLCGVKLICGGCWGPFALLKRNREGSDLISDFRRSDAAGRGGTVSKSKMTEVTQSERTLTSLTAERSVSFSHNGVTFDYVAHFHAYDPVFYFFIFSSLRTCDSSVNGT